jgi:hypothetical protein
MHKSKLPENVLDDLSKFISTYSHEHLPHPLLIAQSFCLKYQEYGEKFSLSSVTEAVEQLVKKRDL